MSTARRRRRDRVPKRARSVLSRSRHLERRLRGTDDVETFHVHEVPRLPSTTRQVTRCSTRIGTDTSAPEETAPRVSTVCRTSAERLHASAAGFVRTRALVSAVRGSMHCRAVACLRISLRAHAWCPAAETMRIIGGSRAKVLRSAPRGRPSRGRTARTRLSPLHPSGNRAAS